MTSKHLSNDKRKLIIESLENGLCNKTEAAELFNTSYSTIINIYRRYCRFEETDKKVRSVFRRKKLSATQLDELKSWLEKDCSLTLVRLREKISDAFGVLLAISSIRNCIADFHFTLKRLEIVSAQKEEVGTENLDEEKKRFSSWYVQQLAAERPVIHVDEAEYKISMRRFSSGKLLKVEKRPVKGPLVKSKNMTVMAAMSADGLFLYKCFHSDGVRDLLGGFLLQVIDKLRDRTLHNAAIVLDRGALDSSQGAVDMIREAGHELVVRPPHCDDINPIEALLTEWEPLVRSTMPQNEDELRDSVLNFDTVIPSSNCAKYLEDTLQAANRYLSCENPS